MVRKFIDLWNVRKPVLRRQLEESNIDSYEELVTLLFKHVLISENMKYELMSVITKDDDGTIIFVLCNEKGLDVIGDFIYTSIYYGSCRTCDALQKALSNDDENLKLLDLMTICLHLIQNCRIMEDEE